MELRTIIEPGVKIAESRYPEVLTLILNYTTYCDEYGDEDMAEHKNLSATLSRITGKDIGQFNLSEYWEEEGAEVLAFRISLPDPVKVNDLSRNEVAEVVRRLKIFEESLLDDQNFSSQFALYLDNYYHRFLALNCSGYQAKLFHRNKDKAGKYFEYSVKEILEKIW